MYNPLEDSIESFIKKKTKVDISILFKKTCTLPKGTLLLRMSQNTDYHNEMFFAFQVEGVDSAYSFNEGGNTETQLWKTIRDIDLPYRIIDVDSCTTKINGALERIYYECFKKWEFAWDFKKFSHPNRHKFLSFLKERGDIGWISSVEDNTLAELFLMNSIDDKKKMIEFQRVVNSSEDYSSFDSFSNVIINK